MDKRERYSDPEEALRVALDGKQGQIWTAIPGIVQRFNAEKMTCEVQPSISTKVRQVDGTFKTMNMPVLLDCPVFFPSGGGVTLTFPIKVGDEVLVVFASRCIDSWWQLGGVQGQAEFRMHDLSDGFVFAGVRSQPRQFSVNTTSAQLRSDDGQAVIGLNPTTHDVTVDTTGNIEMTAPNITMNGNVVINGPLTQGRGSLGGTASLQGPLTVTEDVTAQGTSLHNHTHPDAHGGNTGAPN